MSTVLLEPSGNIILIGICDHECVGGCTITPHWEVIFDFIQLEYVYDYILLESYITVMFQFINVVELAGDRASVDGHVALGPTDISKELLYFKKPSWIGFQVLLSTGSMSNRPE